MKISQMPRNVSISISGKHYFGCDYIFSNIYGSSVFTEEEKYSLAEDSSIEEMSKDPENGDFSSETIDKFISSDTGGLELSTMPESNKEIEYSTTGTVQSDGNGGYFIRYGGDFSPICIHASGNGRFSLNGQDDDFSELVFETGKRNYIVLPESLFLEDAAEDNENQSPITLCLSASEVENSLTDSGGSLHVNYSIEVNGITAEVTDFILTATPSDEIYAL